MLIVVNVIFIVWAMGFDGESSQRYSWFWDVIDAEIVFCRSPRLVTDAAPITYSKEHTNRKHSRKISIKRLLIASNLGVLLL